VRISLILAVGFLAALPSRGRAQGAWGLSAEAGLVRYWGASGPLAGSEDIAVRPHRPTVFGIRVERAFGEVRAAIALRLAQVPIAGEFEGGAAIVDDGFTLLELDPEGSLPVLRLGTGAGLWVFAGPTVSFWALSDEPTRTRIGGRAGLELDSRLTTRLSAVTRLFGGISASAFSAEEIPPGYEVRSMPSAGVSLGLRLRL
jgi:hypothetical protein